MSLAFKILKNFPFVKGHIMKGRIRLPVFRFSQGTQSLESLLVKYVFGSVYSKVPSAFARFIPGLLCTSRPGLSGSGTGSSITPREILTPATLTSIMKLSDTYLLYNCR